MKAILYEILAAILAFAGYYAQDADNIPVAWFFYLWFGVSVYRWTRTGLRRKGSRS